MELRNGTGCSRGGIPFDGFRHCAWTSSPCSKVMLYTLVVALSSAYIVFVIIHCNSTNGCTLQQVTDNATQIASQRFMDPWEFRVGPFVVPEPYNVKHNTVVLLFDPVHPPGLGKKEYKGHRLSENSWTILFIHIPHQVGWVTKWGGKMQKHPRLGITIIIWNSFRYRYISRYLCTYAKSQDK